MITSGQDTTTRKYWRLENRHQGLSYQGTEPEVAQALAKARVEWINDHPDANGYSSDIEDIKVAVENGSIVISYVIGE